MRLHWKLIAIEIILEIVLELAPASLSLMATVTQYLVELTQEGRRASVQLIVSSIGHNSDRQEPLTDLTAYAFKPIPNSKTGLSQI